MDLGRKLAAEAIGTFWLVFGGCGSAVLAAAFPDVGIGLLGVSLAFVKANIIVIVAAIGATTFLMSAGGVMMGRLIGHRFGRSAEVVGGLVLIGLGCLILREHLLA